MKSGIIAFLFILGMSFGLRAQKYQIALNAYNTFLLGDFSSTDQSKSGAGYVQFASGGSLEAKIYIQDKWGIGIRGGFTFYTRDRDAYENDLKAALGITDDNYAISNSAGYGSGFWQFGLSRKFHTSEKFLIEPYVYLGFRSLYEPMDNVVFYNSNGSTYTYSNDATLYGGFNYTLGAKFFWVLGKYTGLYLFIEYDGTDISGSSENEAILYSSDSFQKTALDPDYDLNAINMGLGFAVSFGKGKSQE